MMQAQRTLIRLAFAQPLLPQAGEGTRHPYALFKTTIRAMAAEPSPYVVHLTISGRVQGVSYRVWLRAEAHVRGISGWTRNRANGDVEAVLAGAPEAVRTLCELCRSGPPMARVDQVLITEVAASALEAMGAETGFAVLQTV